MRRDWGSSFSIAVVAGTFLLVSGVDAWVARAAALGAKTLSANALREVELADDMRWQIAQLDLTDVGPPADGSVDLTALSLLAQDVRSYEPLATLEGEHPEWLRLSGITRDLSTDMGRRNRSAMLRDANLAVRSIERLMQINRAEAEAIGTRLNLAGQRQVFVDVLAGALLLAVVIHVARLRLRSMAREQQAVARNLELVTSRSRELEAFAARAAHDLRGPLVPILTLAGLIVRGERDETDVRLANRIAGGASRMSAIIDSMLAFSRSGRLPAGRSEVQAVIAEVLQEFDGVPHGVEIRQSTTDETAACAPEVLGQILRNVIGNAVKYRSPERRSWVEIKSRSEQGMVLIEVADNGVGMDPSVSTRAFEPFFRGTSDGSGHGLGLAIVASYVQALGGAVQLFSEAGVGTRICLRLPRARRAETVPNGVSNASLPSLGAGGPVECARCVPGGRAE